MRSSWSASQRACQSSLLSSIVRRPIVNSSAVAATISPACSAANRPCTSTGSASALSTIARPIQCTRPPRAITPLATAASQSRSSTVTCWPSRPTIRIAATPASDSSTRSHEGRHPYRCTAAVSTIVAKPARPSDGCSSSCGLARISAKPVSPIATRAHAAVRRARCTCPSLSIGTMPADSAGPRRSLTSAWAGGPVTGRFGYAGAR